MNYRIVADDRSLAIEQRFVSGDKSKNPGTEQWKMVAWPGKLHTTAQALLERLVRDKADEQEIKDCEKLTEAVKEAQDEVRAIVQEYMDRAA